ncbi:MAG: hypothetical protein Q9163_002957 [Psora crenata]
MQNAESNATCVIWSWEALYVALPRLENAPDDGSLRRFLADPQTVSLLVRSISPYSAPSHQSKSSFETKTSAINVTPPSFARYNIKDIQDDTVWLSKEANIDEVSALRIAILEWQTRPAAQLLRRGTVEPLSSSKATDGIKGDQVPISLLSQRNSLNDDDKTQRKLRLVGILLSERRFILKCSEYILAHALCTADGEDGRGTPAAEQKNTHWFKAIGLHLLSHWAPEKAVKSKQMQSSSKFLADAIGGIQSRLEALKCGSGWVGLEDALEELEISWGVNQIVEIIHILQIMQDLLQSCVTLMQAEVVLPWFRLMARYRFFEGFQLPHSGLETTLNALLQPLAALVSLTVLNVSSALDLLTDSSMGNLSAPSSKEPAPYILNQSAAIEINDLLISVAPVMAASPTVLAWSIITQAVREIALASRESREIRQSSRAADKYGTADSSDTDGAERAPVRGMSAIRRRSSTSSDTSQQSTLLEEINDNLQITAIDGDPITYLAKNAVEAGKVFVVLTAIAADFCMPFGFEHGCIPDQTMRQCLLHLIRACVGFVDYQPALLMATVAVITGSERYWDQVDRSSDTGSRGPALLLHQDEILRREIFLVALSRFPYESVPLLQLCQALAYQTSTDEDVSGIWLNLQGLDTFTCMLPLDYQGYKTIREDEEADFIELIEDYSFDFNSIQKNSKARPDEGPLLLRSSQFQASANASILLPRGTQGQIMSNGKPLVVAFNYEYSGLSYIGRALQFASTGIIGSGPANAVVSADVVVEAISFINIMLLSATKKTCTDRDPLLSYENASFILEQASDGVERNHDVISIIFQIFENELYKPRETSEEPNSLDILIQCLHFAHALLPIMPDRVWPFLGRSGLLGIDEEVGRLSAVISSYELVAGRYEFLLGCVRLYDALIEDVIMHAVSRRRPTKALTRFGPVDIPGSGVSQLTMEKVVASFQRIMMDVFQSMRNWKFANENDRAEICYWLCIIFEKLLDYCFRVNDDPDPSLKLNSVLLPAANMVLDVCSSRSKTEHFMDHILAVCSEGLTVSVTSLPSRRAAYCIAQCSSVLRFLDTLIQANNYLQRSSPHFEEHLFKAAGLLARLYAAHEAYKLPVINVLDALVRSASSNEEQPPSLLGHVGQEDAHHFLKVLSVLDQPISDNALTISIWRLLSGIVSKRQQWFAHFILTGTTPRDFVKANQGSASNSTRTTETILNMALESLRDIEKHDQQKALAMLEFVALAADFWPSTLIAIEYHPDFLRSISVYASRIGALANLGQDRPQKKPADFNGLRMAAHVADILAMYTHRTQQEGNPKFARMLVPHINHLSKIAILPPSYNTSLHSNLRLNFASKFQGCSLTDFKRTTIMRASLGDSYYYDIELANKMLAFESAWAGKSGLGFSEEVQRANLNLSVVQAQVSWKSLLIELSTVLAAEENFQKIMAQAAADCLHANTESDIPEAFFEKLAQSRADLAFTMLESLNEFKSNVPETKEVLSIAWRGLRSHNADLGPALANKEADYHRSLLKLLYLALQFHTYQDISPSPNPKASAHEPPPDSWVASAGGPVRTGAEIVLTLVAQGFRSLTMLIHDTPHQVQPSDFLLLTALLRSCLRIPGLTRNSEHLVNAFADTQIPRCAASLLSWSHELAASTSGDPVYGEVSVLFLLELSTVPALAEYLAVEGVLPHIMTTNLVRRLQARAFGPLDHPSRMHAIWSRGLLPLLLNLLHCVGPPMAAEVAAAINTFPHQLQRSSEAFSTASRTVTASVPTDDVITLTTAQEAHSIALIVSILRAFREAGASAAVISNEIQGVKWDAVQVKEDVDGWLQRRAALRERIVPITAREAVWLRMRPGKEGMGQNILEEKIQNRMTQPPQIPVKMQALCKEKLEALYTDGSDQSNEYIRKTKEFFAKENLAKGLLNLFQAFSELGFSPRLHYEEVEELRDKNKWEISFLYPPFLGLRVRPNPAIHTAIDLNYEGKRAIVSKLGEPMTWASIIRDCWEWTLPKKELRLRHRKPKTLPLLRLYLLDILTPRSMSDSFDLGEIYKKLLQDRDRAGGVLSLFRSFGIFHPRLKNGGTRSNHWTISFPNIAFRGLEIQPNPDDTAMVDVYVFDTCLDTFNVLDTASNWKNLVQCCWDYGKKREKLELRQVARFEQRISPTPLIPLDVEKLKALGLEGQDVGCPHLRDAKLFLSKGDMCNGLYNLFLSFGVFLPKISRVKEGKEKWELSLMGHYFAEICLRPGSDRSVVIFIDNTRIKSFDVLGPLGELQVIVQWIWNHESNRQIVYREIQGMSSNVSMQIRLLITFIVPAQVASQSQLLNPKSLPSHHGVLRLTQSKAQQTTRWNAKALPLHRQVLRLTQSKAQQTTRWSKKDRLAYGEKATAVAECSALAGPKMSKSPLGEECESTDMAMSPSGLVENSCDSK